LLSVSEVTIAEEVCGHTPCWHSPAGPIVMSACPSFLISFVALWLVETREEGLKSYADMTIYATHPARLVPTMCHHQLPTAIVMSLTLSMLFYKSIYGMESLIE